MPIKPDTRGGKGSFEETDKSVLDDSFVDATIKKASSNIVIFDYMYMLIVGFIKTLFGFMGGAEKISDKKLGDKE